jgi:hypothetical protein
MTYYLLLQLAQPCIQTHWLLSVYIGQTHRKNPVNNETGENNVLSENRRKLNKYCVLLYWSDTSEYTVYDETGENDILRKNRTKLNRYCASFTFVWHIGEIM